MPPDLTGSGLSVLVMERSACGVTVVVAVAVLSVVSGSSVVEVTTAVLVSVPPVAVTVPMIVKVAVALLARLPLH